MMKMCVFVVIACAACAASPVEAPRAPVAPAPAPARAAQQAAPAQTDPDGPVVVVDDPDEEWKDADSIRRHREQKAARSAAELELSVVQEAVEVVDTGVEIRTY